MMFILIGGCVVACVLLIIYALNNTLNERMHNKLLIQQNSFLEREKAYESKIATLESEKQMLQQLLEDNKDQHPVVFKSIASEILANIQERNQQSYTGYLQTFNNTLSAKVEALQNIINSKREEDIALHASLKHTFLNLEKKTEDLINTINGGSSHKGIWGEQVLYKLLEEAGLIKDKDFFIQKQITSDDIETDGINKTIRPDVVVMLPKERCLAIDAKTSLWHSSEQLDDDQFLDKITKNYIRHIKEMCSKKYQSHLKGSLDFMVVFIPFDNLFFHIQHKMPDLLRMANQSNIAIASPSIIIPMIKMIETSWQYDHKTTHLNKILNEIKLFITAIQKCEDKIVNVENALTKAISQVDKLKKDFFDSSTSLYHKASRVDNKAFMEL